MKKNEYLEKLRNNLRNIPEDEANDIMEFYSEYFDDAGVENEDKVMAELGTPERLAVKVSANYVIHDMEKVQEKKEIFKPHLSRIWVIVMAICGSIVWVPLALTAAILLFTVILVMGLLVFSLGLGCIALVAGGVVMFVMGICTMITNIEVGIMGLGAGLLCVGTGIIFFILVSILYEGLKTVIVKAAKRKISNEPIKNNF